MSVLFWFYKKIPSFLNHNTTVIFCLCFFRKCICSTNLQFKVFSCMSHPNDTILYVQSLKKMPYLLFFLSCLGDQIMSHCEVCHCEALVCNLHLRTVLDSWMDPVHWNKLLLLTLPEKRKEYMHQSIPK